MKQTKLISMLMFVMLSSVTLEARDIYVYKDLNIKPIGSSQNVQKIAFNSNGMSVTTESGTVTTFPIADFDYFTCFQRSTTGIKKLQNNLIGITLDGTNLNIKCMMTINKVTIFNASGTEITTFAPQTKSTSHSLSSLPTGVYLVKVVTDNHIFSQKIIK